MSTAAAGAELHADEGRLRRRRGPEPRAAVRAPDPGQLAVWAGATASWPNRTDPGGSRGLDDYFTRDYARNIGAEIMGAQQVRPAPWAVGGPRVAGLVGRRPAVPHAGVRAHPPPPPLVHACRTPRSTSSTRRRPRRSRSRQGGGRRQGRPPRRRRPPTVREFLDADLVDTMHVAVAPVDAGRGERLWESPDELHRPLPPRGRPQPERRGPPPLLAPLTQACTRTVLRAWLTCTPEPAGAAGLAGHEVELVERLHRPPERSV